MPSYPIAHPVTGKSSSLTITAAYARTATEFTSTFIQLYATADCFFRFTDFEGSATLTDHFLAGGMYREYPTNGNTRLAVIGTSGTLYISELA